MKKILALFLICTMILGMIPGVFAAPKEEEPEVLTEEDYYTADLMWEAVNAKEAEMKEKKASIRQTTEALISQVTSSPYYEEDSLIRKGEQFFWETIDGIPCGYSPRLAEKAANAPPLANYDPSTAETVITASYKTRGGSPNSRDVYLIQPYYGLDTSFTTQYVNEAKNIASALGGTATTYRTTGATIDAIANSIESGAVVIFDSHGDTDYAKGEDYVTKANTSYICLQTNTGITTEDYRIANGPFGSYYHAYYAGSYGSMKYYCVDGTAIANHMEKDSPNGMLWMAICLSMATDGLHAPLRERGVEVAYGYSQSVTFEYDYDWEEAFWSKMILGQTVGEAITYMKEEVGLWDWCHASDYDTIAEARATYCAFPIVVSSEDVYPGHGNVDDLQTVHSTWTLIGECVHTDVTYIPAVPVTCTTDGNIAYYQCNKCMAVFTDRSLTYRISLWETVLPSSGHKYDDGKVTTDATCTTDGILTFTCQACGLTYTNTISATGHNFVNDLCAACGMEKPDFVPFSKGQSGLFVIAAKVNNVYYALPNTYTSTSGKQYPITVDGEHGYVPEEQAAEVALTLTYDVETGRYTIYNGSYYLRYPSSTNLGGSTSPYTWDIREGFNGTWRIVSQDSNRGLVYRAAGYQCFGGYYLSNVFTGGREYFDVEILPVVAQQEENIPGGGDTEPEIFVDETLILSHSLNLASDISINYAVKTEVLDAYDTYYLACELPVYSGNGTMEQKIITIDPVLNGSYYYFTLTGITAVQMGDEVKATLHLSKGKDQYVSPTDVYSISTYAYSQLNKAGATEKLKKICAELLRYGTMAQNFKDYRLDALVDAQMTEEHRTYLSDIDGVTFGQNNEEINDVLDASVLWAGKTLNLESKIAVKFIVDLSQSKHDPNELTLRVSYTNYKGEPVEAEIKGATLYHEAKQYYAFELDTLLAAEMRCVLRAAVYHGDVKVSPTLIYSADSYANGRSGELLALCKALMAYSDTALAFFTTN